MRLGINSTPLQVLLETDLYVIVDLYPAKRLGVSWLLNLERFTVFLAKT